jgi:DNA-binding CsgD family transcriptional regulator
MLKKLQESPLQLLTSGVRDLPARQQTLRNAIQWSYDLLEDEEKYTFHRLAAFVGGCTLEAAQSVIGAPASLNVLDSLVGKSLVRQTEMDGAPRLAMLQTIREFGLEQLKQEAELEAARHAHALWYASFAEEAEPHLLSAEQKAWLQRMELEKDNLRAAFRFAIDTGDEALTLRLAGSLGQFWFASGRWSEGRRSLEEALARTGNIKPDPALQAKVLFKAGSLARYQSDFARARGLCKQSLALYRALDDKQGVVMVLAELCRISIYQDDQSAKQGFLAEAAALIESLPDTVEKALAFKELLFSVVFSADPITDETIYHLDQFERILRLLEFRTDLALALALRASLAIYQGNNALAASLLDEAMSLVNEFRDDRLRGRVVLVQVYLDIQTGDYDTARQRLEGIIHLAHKRHDHLFSLILAVLAVVLLEQDMAEWSAKVLGMADKNKGIGQSRPEWTILERFPFMQGFQAKLRAYLGEEDFKQYHMAGKQLSVDDVLAIPRPTTQSKTSPDSLTPRELEVLHLLTEELSNPQIAEQLVVSRRTVDAHLRSIYAKLGVKSRDAALRVGRENRLI